MVGSCDERDLPDEQHEPQEPGFNRSIWRRLEEPVRDWAQENEQLYIVTGPVLSDCPCETIGENEVAVPKRYFKSRSFWTSRNLG
jgi:DNA/RNA endonuclease G (NUC1)